MLERARWVSLIAVHVMDTKAGCIRRAKGKDFCRSGDHGDQCIASFISRHVGPGLETGPKNGIPHCPEDCQAAQRSLEYWASRIIHCTGSGCSCQWMPAGRESRNGAEQVHVQLVKDLILKKAIRFVHVNGGLILRAGCIDVKDHVHPLTLIGGVVYILPHDDTISWEHAIFLAGR